MFKLNAYNISEIFQNLAFKKKKDLVSLSGFTIIVHWSFLIISHFLFISTWADPWPHFFGAGWMNIT